MGCSCVFKLSHFSFPSGGVFGELDVIYVGVWLCSFVTGSYSECNCTLSLMLCLFWCLLSLQRSKFGLHGVFKVIHLSHLFLWLLVVISFVGFVFELDILGGWVFSLLSWDPSILQAILNRVISSLIGTFIT